MKINKWSISFVFLLVTNAILLIKIYIFKIDNNNLQQENTELTVENAFGKEQLYYTNHLIDKNLYASLNPVIIKKEFKIHLKKYLKYPVLIVRYNTNSCYSCIAKFLSWIKDIDRKIGCENIILLQIGDTEFDSTIFPNKCNLLKIKEEDLYIDNPSTEIPYAFVYDVNFEYPLLLFYYPSDIINLDDLYESILVKYFIKKK